VKAVEFDQPGAPEVLELREKPEPVPGEREVVIKVAACGLCGHDSADRAGLTRIELPSVLGHEVSGEIVGLGAKVWEFEVGEIVASKQFATCGRCRACRSGRELDCPDKRFLYGGYAEYVALPADALLRVPGNVQVVEAAVVACTIGSCLQALSNVAQVRPGETVVVTGAGGGLGIHGMQAAVALGARTIALSSSPQKAARLRDLGADTVVAPGENCADELLELTKGVGVDVVIDNVGHPSVFSPCFRALRKRGRYVLTGQLYRERISLFPAFVFGKEALITGSGSTLMSTFMDSMDLVASGAVKVIVERHKLADAAAVHTAMDESRVRGRAVIVP
jgi:acryloyl-coenzyme A reductase